MIRGKLLFIGSAFLIAFFFYGGTKKLVGPSDIGLLESGFLNPPDSARPGVYWYFIDGNLSKEGMTADLDARNQAGIGNVIFLEVNVGVPRRALILCRSNGLNYLSTE